MSETLPIPVFQFPRFPLLNIFCIIVFGFMGLVLPKNQKFYQFVYLTLEFFLILLASFVGGIRLFSLFYIILVIRSCLMLERRNRIIITGLTFFLCSLTQIYRIQNINISKALLLPERLGLFLLTFVLLFGLLLIFLQLSVEAILSERQSREKLAIMNEQLELANAQLRQYALRIENIATLQERNRIAREIHDSLGHSLTVLNLNLEAALKLWKSEPEEATEFLTEAKKLGSTALSNVRESVFALRSDPLEDQSLTQALTSLIENFRRSTNVSLKSSINFSRSMPSELKSAIYRIVQEALTNILKHAAATEVEIEINMENGLYLSVTDNGKGFDINQNTTGFGMQGMRERTLALGGQFEVLTFPNSGCKIIAYFPLSFGNYYLNLTSSS